MALTGAQRQKKWREANRALWNLRRRNLRKGSSLGEKEAAVESNRSRIEMARNMGADTEPTESRPAQSEQGSAGKGEVELSRPPPPFTTKKVGEFRMVVLPEEKPVEVLESTDTRSRSDIAMGIWRNDQGGVISKFAWEKLQKLKKEAKDGGYEIDQYSQ